MVWTQRQSFFPDNPLGALVSGNKKDVVISNLIYTSSAPQRVVIYGWHYTTGSPIQPLYSGHISTYADYSHGIRLVQKDVWVDDQPMVASDVLTSPTLYPLLSDEGQILKPYYPDSTQSSLPIPDTPSSFAVLPLGENRIRILISDNPDVNRYDVYTSMDGSSFTLSANTPESVYDLEGLTPDQLVYVRLVANNQYGASEASELLAAVPSAIQDTILIVNGFDRNSTGNTKDFIRQHGSAIWNYGSPFSSATNNALTDPLLDLQDFRIVDYILGEESTADETFDSNEQQLVKDFLNQGGMLFVSGAEIGWDLENKGSSADRQFYANFLKADYVKDAPNNQSGTFYGFEEISEASIFEGFGSASFDNGSHGTYDVDYPDVITSTNGSINTLRYSNVSDNAAAIYYYGLFPEGTAPGKLVYLGFPFETIYPESQRQELMNHVLDFFSKLEIEKSELSNKIEKTLAVYPNPFDTEIKVDFKERAKSRLMLYDLTGKLLLENKNSQLTCVLDVQSLSPGSYELVIERGGQRQKFKLFKE